MAMPSPAFETLALTRLAFGPSPADRDRFQRQPFADWLAEQLTGDQAQDPVAEQRIAQATLRQKNGPAGSDPAAGADMQPLRSLNQPLAELWDDRNQEKGRPRVELAAATLIRAVYSRWQLREVLVDFWHNHFNVNAVGDNAVAVALPSYDRDVIRPHALGNFRALLEAVASSTAMLVYLNNRSSRAGNANENYARELFELHTLGRANYLNTVYDQWRKVPGALDGHPIGYIDQDVYEAARAFTGWSIADGAGIGPGQNLPKTGAFTYVESWHDNYQKRVLGTEFEPFQAPLADGRRVLDLVAHHPATARHICTKLGQRLVSDTPSDALVTAAAAVWTRNRDQPRQIAEVVRCIVMHRDFAASAAAKVKRPLEVAASYLRATEIDFTPTEGLLNQLAAGGQRLFGWPAPTGHPDTRDYWLSTNAMRQRWALLFGLTDNHWQTGIFDPTRAPGRPNLTALQAADFWQQRLLGAVDPALSQRILTAMRLAPDRPLANGQDPAALRHLVAYLAMSPAFQLR